MGCRGSGACHWAHDKDSIVLLYEYMLEFPPDGIFEWEWAVCRVVMILWDPMTGSGQGLTDGWFVWEGCKDEEAPGWRMLTSLPSCPNHHMRFPTSPRMLEHIRRFT